MPSLTVELKHNSALSRRILSAVSQRVTASKRAYDSRHRAWNENEKDAVAYLHERDIDRVRRLDRTANGEPDYTTLKIPYSYGVLMASHTYWTTVFLSRTPVNQFTGRHGESVQQVQALEALVDYQVQVGDHLVPLYLWLLDVGKYGLGVIGIHWSQEHSIVSEIKEEPVLYAGFLNTGKTKKRKINRRVDGYAGNRLTNIRPYDFFPDPRVPVRFFQKGEFCASRIEVGWNAILKRTEQGFYIKETVSMLGQSSQGQGFGGFGNDTRVAGSSQVQLPQSETFTIDDTERRTAGKTGGHNTVIAVYECTIEIVPKEWGLGSNTYPEKWVFTVTADFHYVLGAQPLGANHDKFPYSVLEYEPEGYSISSRGIGEVLRPINDTMDWLINSHLYSVRKALNDQFVVDPSMVELSDVENPLPGGVIRLSAGAYGQDTRSALTQLNVHDVTQQHLTDMTAMLNIGQRAVGISDQLMGQINAGGRRSATEVRTGTGFGINRLKTTSEFFSAMGWSPLASMIVQNSQQYYNKEQKFKVVGALAAEAGQEFVNVTPESILGFYDFVPVDGTQPVDKIAQAQLWQQIFGQLTNFPDLMMKYDIGRIFEWIAQLAGLKNISQFRIELTPEEELIEQARKGNLASLGGGGNNAPESATSGNGQGGSGSGTPNTGPPPPLQSILGGSSQF